MSESDDFSSITYDEAGNLESLTDPVGNVTTWRYDDYNQLVEEIDPLGASRYYAYNEAGNMTRYTDRNGQVRAYEYDSNHRVITETWYAAEGAGDSGLEAGELGATGSASAVTESATGSASAVTPLNTIKYEYDKAGNLISESDDFSSITYVYDDLGRQTNTTQSSLGGPTVTLTNEYDGVSGQRSSLFASIDGVSDFVNDYTSFLLLRYIL